MKGSIRKFMLLFTMLLFAVTYMHGSNPEVLDSVIQNDAVLQVDTANQAKSVTEIVPTSNGVISAETEYVIDLGTFAGIVALISALVTQLFKVIPSIDSSNKLIKIALSVGVGIIVCMIAWALQISTPLLLLSWWQALLYGVAAGLSGCGFYDVIKAIAELIKPKA